MKKCINCGADMEDNDIYCMSCGMKNEVGNTTNKVYKVRSGPKNITVSHGDIGSAFQEFQDIINYETQNGWTYHSMETLQVTEKPGCGILGKLFGKDTIYFSYMLIFEREQ